MRRGGVAEERSCLHMHMNIKRQSSREKNRQLGKYEPSFVLEPKRCPWVIAYLYKWQTKK